jgi:hypothetical protein
MRIVDVGTFLLPVRFSLSDLMAGGRERVVAAVESALPECGPGHVFEPSEVLLDFHRSQGARQMESMVFEGATSIEGLGPVRIYISSLSVGFVVVEFELPDDTIVDLEITGSRQSFKAYETPVSEALKPKIAGWCESIARSVDPELTDQRPQAGLPAGQLLWWHRIAVNPPTDQEFPAARWYGVRADLAHDMVAMMGNGFSLIYGDHEHVIDEVVEGLMVETQEWLIVDEAKRLLAEHLIRLSRSREAGLVSVDTQYLEVLKLTEEVTLRNLILSEEVRYLANARMRVKEATALAWRMSEEVAELEQRTTALRDLFSLHRERIFNDRDNRRNRLVFVFTALTLIQGILIWYDFLTSNNNVVADNPRPPIATVVLVATVATLVGAFGYRYIDAFRRRWRERGLVPDGDSGPAGAGAWSGRGRSRPAGLIRGVLRRGRNARVPAPRAPTVRASLPEEIGAARDGVD